MKTSKRLYGIVCFTTALSLIAPVPGTLAATHESPGDAEFTTRSAAAPQQDGEVLEADEVQDEVGGQNTVPPTGWRNSFPRTYYPPLQNLRGQTDLSGEQLPSHNSSGRSIEEVLSGRERTEFRTEFSRTFESEDGRERTVFGSQPLNYRDVNGAWQVVDLSFKSVEEGHWETVSSRRPVKVRQRDGANLAHVDVAAENRANLELDVLQHNAALLGERGQQSRSLTLSGAESDQSWKVTPTIDGLRLEGRAKYLGDIKIAGQGGAFREVSPGQWQQGPDVTGWQIRAHMTQPTAEGQSLSPNLLFVSRGEHWEFKKAADLMGDDLVTVEISSQVDPVATNSVVTWSDSKPPQLGDDFEVGHRKGTRHGAGISFPGLERIRGERILSASLAVLNYDSASCDPSTYSIHRMTKPWQGAAGERYPDTSEYEANKQLGTSQEVAGFVAHGEAESSCPVHAHPLIPFDQQGRDTIAGWANQTIPNYGVLVRAADESNQQHWRKFAGLGTANAPQLLVEHTPWDATYVIDPKVAPNPLVLKNQDGFVDVTVTNKSLKAWTPDSFYLSGTLYRIENKPGEKPTLTPHGTRFRAAWLNQKVEPGGVTHFHARIPQTGLEGEFLVDFRMAQGDGLVFSSLPRDAAHLQFVVPDLPPQVKETFPPSGWQAPSLSPDLWARAIDSDEEYPPGVEYSFRICAEPQQLTATAKPEGCWERVWSTSPKWTVPSGYLKWNNTYWWKATVRSRQGAPEVSTPAVALMTDVPQPASGASAASNATDRPFDPIMGGFATSGLDAPINSVGPKLQVSRSYNSHDYRTQGAFGPGWASRLDAVLEYEANNSVVVTDESGKRSRFGMNPDGTFAGPNGSRASLLKIDDPAGTEWKYRQADGSTLTFKTVSDIAGKALFRSIEDKFGRRLIAEGGLANPQQIAALRDEISGRKLKIVWEKGRVVKVIQVGQEGSATAAGNKTWTYAYTDGRLSEVCNPDKKKACTKYSWKPGSGYRGSVLDSKPEAYWRMRSFKENTALSEVEINAGKDNGTFHDVKSRPAKSDDIPLDAGGEIARFESSDAHLSIPPEKLPRQRESSIELWFKTGSIGEAQGLVGFQDKNLVDRPSSGRPLLYIGADGKLYGQFPSGHVRPMRTPFVVADHSWHHVALVATSGTQQLWVDGRRIVDDTLSAPDAPLMADWKGVQIGATHTHQPSEYESYGQERRLAFSGEISEVATHFKALSQDQIEERVKNARTPFAHISEVKSAEGQILAKVDYNQMWGRVSKFTDANGGVWNIGLPSITSTDTELRRTVFVTDSYKRPWLYESDPKTGRITRTGTPTGVTPSKPVETGSSLKPGQTNCPPTVPGEIRFCIVPLEKGTTGPMLVDLEPLGVRTLRYDVKGNVAAIINEVGNWTYMTYDDRGNQLSQKTCKDGRESECATKFTEYSGPEGAGEWNPADLRWDKPIGIRDGRSSGPNDDTYKTERSYNNFGDIVSQTEPDGRASTTYYTTDDTVRNVDASDGDPTRIVPKGLVSRTVDALGNQTTFKYKMTGDLARIIEPTGVVVEFAYDELGRKISQTVTSKRHPKGLVTQFVYDEVGRTQRVKEPTIHTDAMTGSTGEKGLQQKVTELDYDRDGRPVMTTTFDAFQPLDSNSTRSTLTEYKSTQDGRVQTVIDPDGKRTSTYFDLAGDAVKVVDAAGRIQSYRYNARHANVEAKALQVKLPGVNEGKSHDVVLQTTEYDRAGRVFATTDGLRRRVEFAYNGDDTLAVKVLKNYKPSLTEGAENAPTRDYILEKNFYDGAGHIVEQITNDGTDITQNHYDTSGRLVKKVTDPRGIAQTETIAFNGNGTVASMTTEGKSSNVPAINGPDASLMPIKNKSTVYFEYDLYGRQTVSGSLKDGEDSQNLPSEYKKLDDLGLVVASYSPRGNTASSNRNDYETLLDYDEMGRLISRTSPKVLAEDASGVRETRPITRFIHNVFGEQTTTVGPDGSVTKTEFDKSGRKTRVEGVTYQAPGSTETVTPVLLMKYDELGRVAEETDPLGREKTYGYDDLGRLHTKTMPGGKGDEKATWQYFYTPTGKVNRTVGPDGAEALMTYDQLDRPVTTTRVERFPEKRNYTSRMVYNKSGEVDRMIDPRGDTTSFTYNSVGKVISSVDPAGVVTKYGYNGLGVRVLAVDGLGRQHFQVADEMGRVTSDLRLDPQGKVLARSHVSYDVESNVTSTSNPWGAETKYSYDALNRLTQQVEKVSDNHFITTSFGYDVKGNRTRYTDGRGNSTHYTYNSLDLPESVIEPTTLAHPEVKDRTWTTSYNAAGQPIELVAPGGVKRTRTFDAAGRLVKEIGEGPNTEGATRSLGYDLAGRLICQAVPGITDRQERDKTEDCASSNRRSAGKNTYTYNDAGQILKAEGPGGKASFAYDEAGVMRERSDAAGKSAFTFEHGRLTNINDAITQTDQKLEYDAAGEVERIRFADGRLRTYNYDGMGRTIHDVISKDDQGTLKQVSKITYGYDNHGRLASRDMIGFGKDRREKYGYDLAHRMTSWQVDDVSTLYEWDDSGNRVRNGDKVSTFDARNRLLSDGKSTYEYSPRGTLEKIQGERTLRLAFDAFDRMVSYGNLKTQYDSLDRAVSARDRALKYAGIEQDPVADGETTFARASGGELLAANGAQGKRLLISDRHGDVVGGLDPRSGATSLADYRVYDPWGNTQTQQGIKFGVGYQGSWTDDESGQVKMGARWYDPETGSFNSRDTAVYSAGPSALANKYLYAGADPMSAIDPDGHWPKWLDRAASSVGSHIQKGLDWAGDKLEAGAKWVNNHVIQPIYNHVIKPGINLGKRIVGAVVRGGAKMIRGAKSMMRNGGRWIAQKYQSGRAMARAKAEEARQRVEAVKQAVTQKARDVQENIAKYNPLPLVKAGYDLMVDTGREKLTQMANFVEERWEEAKETYHEVHAKIDNLVEKGIEFTQAAVSFVSEAYHATIDWASEHKSLIIGVALGVAGAAVCTALTAGVGAVACAAAAGAIVGGITKGMDCPEGRSMAGCIAQGAIVGGATGALALVGGPIVGGLVSGFVGGVGDSVGDQALGSGHVDVGQALIAGGVGGLTGGLVGGAGKGLGKVFGKSEAGPATKTGGNSCGNSFPAATPIVMADGTSKPLGDVKLGDQILAGAPVGETKTTGQASRPPLVNKQQAETAPVQTEVKTASRKVTGIIRHTVMASMVALTFSSGGAVQATANHPIYEPVSGTYQSATDFQVGAQVLGSDGKLDKVVKVVRWQAPTDVANLTVETDHTYFVKVAVDSDALVHNCPTTDDALQGPAVSNDDVVQGPAISTEMLMERFKELPEGNNPRYVRRVADPVERRALYEGWIVGAEKLPSRGPKVPEVHELPDGTIVQWRTGSSAASGGGATIDIKIPGTRARKVH